MRRHPPRPTLFPYTTLFRSRPVRPRVERPRLARGRQCRRLAEAHIHEYVIKGIQDRKSTRLNSSHRCISYAVFCLKKKKITNTRRVTLYGVSQYQGIDFMTT